MPRTLARTLALTAVAALGAGFATASTIASATPPRSAASPGAEAGVTLAYPHLALPGGQWAAVYSDGIAEVHRGADDAVEIQQLPLLAPDGNTGPVGDGTRELPALGDLISDLVHGPNAPYAANQVIVVYTDRVAVAGGVTTATAGNAVPAYTSSTALNQTLSRLGVDQQRQLFGGTMRSSFAAMRNAAQTALGKPILDFTHAYLLHVRSSGVAAAVSTLRATPGIVTAEPNWTVTTTHTPSQPLPASVLKAAEGASASTVAAGIPDNYTLRSSAQSLLNRPGVDAVPAFSALAAKHRLPGQGETITNVSLGTLDDASAAQNPKDKCNFYATAYGPTTEVLGGQRYIDWPSMPLIPTYTADSSGVLDPLGETCGDDPTLTEVGLDFSMMAPLPHDAQRPGHEGNGLTDLLGIAPGANYRLVLPATPGGNTTDVDAAFLAAANQSPRPDIITASLGFGLDSQGFASRYLEDDPLTEAVLTSIVHGYHIVVTVSSGDGLRTATNAAVAPAGGSVATQVAKPGAATTDLNDVAYSDAVSRDYDSGAISVGGSTLNDIFAAPPQDPRNRNLAYLQAFPTTRYDGGRLYSSGFGSRVNVSAPGDSVLSFMHTQGGAAQDITEVLEGGTSASAPEVAAVAAVVQQVARMTHDTTLASNPVSMRTFLEQSATGLRDPEQADRALDVGPQVDLGKAVQRLLAAAGQSPGLGVPRVAVAQRQQGSALGGSFTTTTDPTDIPLGGPLGYAWITVAPDWTGLPASGMTYRLVATTGPEKTLATTPWARLQPSAILAAAGLSLRANTMQSVPLVYEAIHNGKQLLATGFSLTFGPTDGSTPWVLAPTAPPVVTGDTIPVKYDIRHLTGAQHPTLVVSNPGRVDTATGKFFRPAYTVALTEPVGTIDVPVSALQGGGIYGIGIQEAPGGWFSANDSAFVFVRVAPAGSAQPSPPTLAVNGSIPAHYLAVPYHGSFQLSYDVRGIAGVTGAAAEFSAPGPTAFNNYETFNNPGGTQRDANGHDTGSTAYLPLTGTHGTVTISAADAGLVPTMNQLVRVVALHGGAAAAEASGVSSISEDGVAPNNGGSVAGGFGINENGADGFLTANATAPDGSTVGSVETFDQSTGHITGTPASGDEYETIAGGCAGLFANDTGLYEDYDPSSGADRYRVIDPVATGKLARRWTPSTSMRDLVCAAHNQQSTSTAILSSSGGAAGLQVNDSNIAANTFSRPVPLAPALAGMTSPSVGGFGQNARTGTAVAAVNDSADTSLPIQVVTANAKTGAVGHFTGVTVGFPSGVAVDSRANVAAIGSYEGFGVYRLGARTGTLVTPGGSSYQHPAADSVHHELLVQEVAPPTLFGENPDNNATSSIVVADDSGKVLQRISGFNFYNIYLANAGDYVQVNPSTGVGYTLGPGGTQLQPFVY